MINVKENVDTSKEENAQNPTHAPTPLPISYQDLIVSSIGKIGRWQFFVIFAIMVPKVFIGWSIVAVTFSLGKTDWCRVTTITDPMSMLIFLYELRLIIHPGLGSIFLAESVATFL